MALHYHFAAEDALRLAGLEDALRRDMRMAMAERTDYIIFNGDDGANENSGDISSIFSASGITAKTLSQTNNVKWPETVRAFASLLDGKAAERMEDLR